MAMQDAMGLFTGLLSQAQALSALAAHLRLNISGNSGDPVIRQQIDRVIGKLQAHQVLDDLDADERAILVSLVQSYLRQALDLIENPEQPGSWSHSDPTLLQAQGAFSTVVATLFAQAGIGRPDARILDVGTGVARLAMAFCDTYPQSTVVGLDPWEPALNLARENVAAAGLESRISLIATPVQSFEDPLGFDLVWFPAFFIPEAILDAGLGNVFRHTRAGGAVVVGATDNSEDELNAIVDDLITVRSGGTALTPPEAVRRLIKAGFVQAREIERTWQAPVRLVVGHRG